MTAALENAIAGLEKIADAAPAGKPTHSANRFAPNRRCFRLWALVYSAAGFRCRRAWPGYPAFENELF